MYFCYMTVDRRANYVNTGGVEFLLRQSRLNINLPITGDFAPVRQPKIPPSPRPYSQELADGTGRNPSPIRATDRSTSAGNVKFAWLELTGQCQELCTHCYADSGPDGTHGSMTPTDWRTNIDQLAERGTKSIQFIGGEPTLHPNLPELVEHALEREINVEIYSNMVHIPPAIRLLAEENSDAIHFATSYYSPNPEEHREITGRKTLNPIRKNIQWATDAGIDLRVGVIGVQEGQDIDGATAELIDLGVDPDKIGIDYRRQVGRGIQDELSPEPTSEFCGNCADEKVAILPDGSVQPCVFARQDEFTIGNVHNTSLTEILDGEEIETTRNLLREAFDNRTDSSHRCGPTCSPEDCIPTTVCGPMGDCTPTHDCKPTR